jgi:acetylornithine deacetylase/succinyl-diaminopimelate desuccinylase-like protein
MDPVKVASQLKAFLEADTPWGVEVKVSPLGAPCNWWMTDPNGPAFEAALAAMRDGFERDPVAIGCGGSIGFVGPLAELFGGAPALLMGIEDPASNAHAPNESLHEGDFKKLMNSLVRLFDNVGKLPANGVK